MGKKRNRAKAPENAAVTATSDATPNEGATMEATSEVATATEATPPERVESLAEALAADPDDAALAELLAKGDAAANAAEVVEGGEKNPDAEMKEGLPLVRKSTTERPCKRVWAIAEAALKQDPPLGRKAILQKCLDEGIAFYTARTQYQQFAAMRKEELARAAAKNAPPAAAAA